MKRQRPEISKRINVISSPSSHKQESTNQVTFGSNFDHGLESQHLGCPVYKNGTTWCVYLHFECSSS